MQSQQPFKRESKIILPKPFTYDDVSINVSYSESKEEDQVELYLGIEYEFQSNPNPVPTPNPSPKWGHKVIEETRNMTRETSNMRRTRY